MVTRTRHSTPAFNGERKRSGRELGVELEQKTARNFDPGLAEPLQQVDRTYVLHRGRRLSYFAGCDYYRMASHPDVVKAVHTGLDTLGLNVAASRKTTGNHSLYGELEKRLARFFQAESAILVSSGYMTNLAVGQALAGEFTHAVIDGRSHGCLFDAARILGCPVHEFKHRDANSARQAVRQAGRSAKVLLLTDGLFSHSGMVAPLDEYLRILPKSVTLLVDDAHSGGILGRHGRGTPEHLGVSTERIVQTITLSKAFGVYGGAVLGSQLVRRRIIERSRLFIGNTPLPLPLVAGILTSLELVRSKPDFPKRLMANTRRVKDALAAAGLSLHDGPGPIVPVTPRDDRDAARLKKALLAAGIYPPYINYLGGPRDAYFRFVISSEHTREQLDSLIAVLVQHLRAARSEA